MNTGKWQRIAWVVCAAALALHAVTAFVMSAGPVGTFTLQLFAFSCAPYLAMLVLATPLKQPIPGAAGASAALLADAAMFWSVFIQPKGSTAALGLLFMPIWNLLVIAPAVAAVAFVFTRGPKRDSHLV
jgi:hypothetical protein